MRNKYGNIYANLIEKPGKTVEKEGYQVFRNDVHYGDLGTNQIQFSLDTKRQLKKRLLEANNPKKVEPTFILEVGSKKTESNTFQQWQVTYNPAYSYMKPWWMSTVSLSLMSSEQYNVKLNMNPGFCPYIPALKLDQIHKTQLVLEDTFKEADRKITTLSWQK